MKEWGIGAIAKLVLAAIIGGLTTLLGGFDDMLLILTVFIALDITSGWLRAFIQKKLSSQESWRGTVRKVLIYVIVVVAAQLDRLTASNVIRNAVAIFYCASEALSILENAVAAGLPVPDFLREVLVQLNEKKFVKLAAKKRP